MSKLLELINELSGMLIFKNKDVEKAITNLKEYEWRRYLDEINGH